MLLSTVTLSLPLLTAVTVVTVGSCCFIVATDESHVVTWLSWYFGLSHRSYWWLSNCCRSKLRLCFYCHLLNCWHCRLLWYGYFQLLQCCCNVTIVDCYNVTNVDSHDAVAFNFYNIIVIVDRHSSVELQTPLCFTFTFHHKDLIIHYFFTTV